MTRVRGAGPGFRGAFFRRRALAAACFALAASGAAESSWAASCYPYPAESAWRDVVRGDFFGDGRSIGLAMPRSEDAGCRIALEAGGGAAAPLGVAADYADFAGVCRDPDSGRDHAIVHLSAGQYHEVSIWAARPPPAAPERLYAVAWADAVYGRGEGWGIDELVAPDGACLWRERKRRLDAHDAAMAALRIDRGAHHGEPDDHLDGLDHGPLAWREVAAETARERLAALREPAREGLTVFEGAVYADAAARDSWFVVQVFGGELCAASGAVLALDRKTGRWKSIYDVPSGCSKSWAFPMCGMVVAGDTLYAALCSDCSGWGRYADYAIDLRANRVSAVERGAGAPGPREDDNPDLDAAAWELLRQDAPEPQP